MKINFLTTLCLMMITCFSCQKKKEQLNIQSDILPEISASTYYQTDPLPDSLNRIYGKWKFLDMTGGIGGISEKGIFDFLLLKKNGIFGVRGRDSLISYGKLEWKNMPDKLNLHFTSDKAAKREILDHFGFAVSFRTSDTLLLDQGCCDLYIYKFVRVR